MDEENSLPYFFNKYMKNSGSLRLTEMIAPAMENEVTHHGPGNLDRGWRHWQ